jgi:hypothetical protein
VDGVQREINTAINKKKKKKNSGANKNHRVLEQKRDATMSLIRRQIVGPSAIAIPLQSQL